MRKETLMVFVNRVKDSKLKETMWCSKREGRGIGDRTCEDARDCETQDLGRRFQYCGGHHGIVESKNITATC